MQVFALDDGGGGVFAWCEGRGRRERLNVSWIGPVAAGEWVYAFLGLARHRLSPDQAREINEALDAVEFALSGGPGGAR